MNHKKIKYLFIFFLLFVCVGNQTIAQENAGLLKGYVYHQDGTPFNNALVTLVANNQSKLVTTDSLGYYGVAYEEGCILRISFPQHFTKEVYPVVGELTKTFLVREERFSYERTYSNMVSNIKLKNSSGTLLSILPEEGAEENETADGIWKGSAGMYSERQSGMPGAGSMNIMRGIHSLHTSHSPIIVVDGMYLGDYNFDNPAIQGNSLFNIMGLNPEDIEEIIFLKDGVSTLKYGVKGANGIILINTKRAKVSKTRIAANFSSGISMFNKELPMLGTTNNRQYLQYQMFNKGLTIEQVNELYPEIGTNVVAGEYPRWEQNTNWQDQIRKTSFRNKLDFAFSGGDEISKFYFSLGYTGNKGTIENTKMDRLNARLNADISVSEKLNLKVNMGFGYTESSLFDLGPNYITNPIFASLIKSPQLGVYEAIKGGLYLENYDPEDIFEYSNPKALISNSEILRKNYFLLGSFRFNYQFNKNWYANIMVGNNLNQLDDDVFIPTMGIGRMPGSEAEQTIRKKDSKSLSWYTNNEIGYLNNWNNMHNLAFTLGMNLISNQLTTGAGSVLNTGTDLFTAIQFGDVTTRYKYGEWVKDSWLNSYLTANYIYKNKYFLNAGLSLNGSSRFGKKIEGNALKIKNNYYALLPSFSAAWNIAGEGGAFGRLFDYFKLKAAYSLRGNDLFNNFVAKSYYVPVQYYDITGLVKGGVMNSGISWETSQNIELGVDMAFTKEKINLSLNYFNENVKDVIAKNNLSEFYGFNTMLDNTSKISMKGFEAMIRAFVIDKRNFSWETEVNLTTSSSKIKDLSNDEIIDFIGGQKINRENETPFSFYGWNFKGVFSTDQQAQTAGVKDEFGRSFKAGDAIFEDVNKDKIIDAKDKQVLGNPLPDFWGAWVNRITYGKFSLFTKTSFSVGRDVFNYTRSQLESGSTFFNQTTSILNAWTKQGDNTDVPKLRHGDPLGNARFSSRWIEDASFIRIEDVTLSYSFPVKKKGIRGIKLYATGKNLLVLSDYLGYDPEFSYGLDTRTMGIDYFSAPVGKSYIIGVKLDF